MIWLVRDSRDPDVILGAYNNEATASMHASDVLNGYTQAVELAVEYEKEKRGDGND